MKIDPVTGRIRTSIIDDLSRPRRVVFLDSEPRMSTSAAVATGFVAGVLACGLAVVFWTLV